MTIGRPREFVENRCDTLSLGESLTRNREMLWWGLAAEGKQCNSSNK